MNNLSIRHGLLATLVIFGLMIVFGAVLGVSQLSASSDAAERIHLISSRAILLNDAYKDMTRARSALTRAYSSAKASGQVNDDALASATKSIGKSKDELDRFEKAEAIPEQDAATRDDIIAAGRSHMEVVQRGLDALRKADPDGYAAINDRDITSSGAK